ncbi:MerR family transcriptional regulator [Pontibacillus salipaludis]|uniref:MerR family transcriptional regulator n=1 Tax=Pontibacillus salipaludis TaxID=1697394 RepID=A0ABQ1Q6I1_9BACI|nr:MerR family transcriptional regulator [Pontibacillus salipaludis]GGD15791.1 MerR family transcriptional regulator [Pontibacillus salipaludis]
MKIKEAANRLNTTPRTIRFYEEKGLIQPDKGENDYRSYNEHHLWKLQTILSLREVGMSTQQIKHTLQNEEEVECYLNVQRSALYEQWLEIKDMIGTIDQMLDKSTDEGFVKEDIFALADQLKNVKEKRKGWQDQWDFNGQARDYDKSLKMNGYRFNVHEHYEEALEKAVEVVQPKEGEKGVDIGIGTGNLGSQFTPKGACIIGVDQSDEMLSVCKEKHPQIDVRHGHFLALPVMDGEVDFITTSYALHHVTEEEKELALREMDRILKPNGRIAIVDLMFADQHDRECVVGDFKDAGNQEAIFAIEDEYYANRSNLVAWFEQLGYKVHTHSFNNILHMVYAEKQ